MQFRRKVEPNGDRDHIPTWEAALRTGISAFKHRHRVKIQPAFTHGVIGTGESPKLNQTRVSLERNARLGKWKVLGGREGGGNKLNCRLLSRFLLLFLPF